MFCAYLVRHFSLDTFFSTTKGIYVADPSQYVNMAYRWGLLSEILPLPSAQWLVPLLHSLYLVCLLLLIFGVITRAASILAFILHVSFVHANIGAVYGVDLIFTFYLFFICLASDRVTPEMSGPRVWFSSLGFRFAQIQLCIIYAFSGWEKLKGPVWWNGEALWSVIANPQMARFEFGWMVHLPLVLVFVAYLTLFWEIYFPVLIWIPRLRVPTLLVGLWFHLSIVLMMKLAFFGFLMIGIYVLFLTDHEVQVVWKAIKRVPGFRRLALKNL